MNGAFQPPSKPLLAMADDPGPGMAMASGPVDASGGVIQDCGSSDSAGCEAESSVDDGTGPAAVCGTAGPNGDPVVCGAGTGSSGISVDCGGVASGCTAGITEAAPGSTGGNLDNPVTDGAVSCPQRMDVEASPALPIQVKKRPAQTVAWLVIPIMLPTMEFSQRFDPVIQATVGRGGRMAT